MGGGRGGGGGGGGQSVVPAYRLSVCVCVGDVGGGGGGKSVITEVATSGAESALGRSTSVVVPVHRKERIELSPNRNKHPRRLNIRRGRVQPAQSRP